MLSKRDQNLKKSDRFSKLTVNYFQMGCIRETMYPGGNDKAEPFLRLLISAETSS